MKLWLADKIFLKGHAYIKYIHGAESNKGKDVQLPENNFSSSSFGFCICHAWWAGNKNISKCRVWTKETLKMHVV